MASSLLVLLDDIATVLDDVAVLTKAAAKKTAGVLGDDLAVNAEKVSGVSAARELPVVWAVFKGSMLNKCILVPAALAISALAPWAITPLLMLGGAFLCFEGCEKIVHWLFHDDSEHHAELTAALTDPESDLVAFEAEKIKGAIRTDFILSAEIIAITLGVVSSSSFGTRVGVLTGIAVLMTIGVYGLVAGIVKLDDAGLFLSRRPGEGPLARLQRRLGDAILWAAPYPMRGLTIAGTAAMFLVGGGILTHGLPPVAAVFHVAIDWVAGMPAGGALAAVAPFALDAVFGIVVGALVVLLVTGVQRLRGSEGTSEGQA